MTTIIDLKKMVYSGESDQVEFKKKVNHPEKIIREMVAFANAKGGNLLIGVDDEKNIVGVKDPDEEIEILNKRLKELVRPEIKFTIDLIPITRKRKVVFYRIRESRKKPHFVNPNPNSKRGTAYFRYHDKTIQASKELVNVIRKRKTYKNGFMLEYGKTEEQMIKCIDSYGSMTINEIRDFTGIDKKKISMALVRLILANVLDIEPRDGEDLFLSKQPA